MTSDPSHAQPNPEDEDSDVDLDRAFAKLTAGLEQAEPLDRPRSVAEAMPRSLGIRR
jgi:hypothetical protein